MENTTTNPRTLNYFRAVFFDEYGTRLAVKHYKVPTMQDTNRHVLKIMSMLDASYVNVAPMSIYLKTTPEPQTNPVVQAVQPLRRAKRKV